MAEAKGKAVVVNTGQLPGRGGVDLFWREWAPGEGKFKRVIVFVHGAGEHSGRYEALGHFFASRGTPVLALDLRGLGRSGGTRGHVARFEDYHADVLALRELAERRYPGSSFVLVGHSMGGLISLGLAQEREGLFDAVVASAPCLELAVRVPAWKALLGRVRAGILPRLSMKNEIDPAVLARNPEVGRAYAGDPHVCRTVTAGWFVALLRAMTETNTGANRLKLPVFILQGTDDRLVLPAAAQRFFDSLGAIPKRYENLDGLYHELFQEDEREEIFGLIQEWLDEASSQGSKRTEVM